MAGTQTSLGDLFECFDALQPRNAETERLIARFLHFEEPTDASARLHGAWHKSQAQLGSTPPPSGKPAREQPTGRTLATPRADTVPAHATVATLTGTRPASLQTPHWISAATPMPTSEIGTPAEPDPLFEPRQTRNIVSAGVATRVEEGSINVRRILDILASLQPLLSLPRHPIGTLRRGAQVLIDLGTGMMPYAADREQLVVALTHVVGHSRITVRGFRATPLRALEASDDSTAWRLPARGTPVVLVSDFGIGGGRPLHEQTQRRDWLEVARTARAAGCPIIGFIPFGPRRWDRAVAKAITLIHWDRSTSVGDVRRVIGRGHELP